MHVEKLAVTASVPSRWGTKCDLGWHTPQRLPGLQRKQETQESAFTLPALKLCPVFILNAFGECFVNISRHFLKKKWGRWLQVISSTTRFGCGASFQWRKLKKEINNSTSCFPSTGIPSTADEKVFQEQGAVTELSRTDKEAGWNFMGEISQCWDFRRRGTWSGRWEKRTILMTKAWTDWTEEKRFGQKRGRS